MNIVVTFVKDFPGGLKDADYLELSSKLTGSAGNVADSYVPK